MQRGETATAEGAGSKDAVPGQKDGDKDKRDTSSMGVGDKNKDGRRGKKPAVMGPGQLTSPANAEAGSSGSNDIMADDGAGGHAAGKQGKGKGKGKAKAKIRKTIKQQR